MLEHHGRRVFGYRSSRVLLFILYVVIATICIWQYQVFLRNTVNDDTSVTTREVFARADLYATNKTNETTVRVDGPPSMITDPPESFVAYKDYCVYHDVITPRVIEYDRIAQILHISAEMLNEKIIDHTTNWQAPVSLTVFARDSDQYHCAKQKLKSFLTNPSVREYLRAHLLIPRGEVLDDCMVPAQIDPCPETEQELTVDQIATYPANIARNTARLFSQSKYILIADFEHMFSESFEQDVRELANKHLENDPKRVLVYRIFEVDKASSSPKNITDLFELMQHGNAVVFHQRYYKGAHNMPGLDEWFSEGVNRTRVKGNIGLENEVEYDDEEKPSNLSTNSTDQSIGGISEQNMKYTRYDWEPQFVSLSTIPMHDENFPFLIRDNTCLRWELCRSGYKFDLLADHFMYHMGIKTASSGVAKRSATIQKKNYSRFNKALSEFKTRMDRDFPDSKSNCPSFRA